MVGTSASVDSEIRMITLWDGGSSSTLSRLFAASARICSVSSMMNTFHFAS